MRIVVTGGAGFIGRAVVERLAARGDHVVALVRDPRRAAHLTRASLSLRALRGVIASALARYERVLSDERALESLDFQTAINLLKVTASELASTTVTSALQACGLSGYRNDGEFSVTRQLRDILSASVMISNDRILSNVANAALLIEVPPLLRD